MNVEQELIDQLADGQTRESARTQLLHHGSAAVPALLSVLKNDLHDDHRRAIMQVLLELNDPTVAGVFRESLSSKDEVVRSIAAQALSKLGVADAVDACLATINDAPDPLHFDVTPSVHALSLMGMRVLPRLLPLLSAADARTRQRAQRILERVTFDEISKTLKPRPLSDVARIAWNNLWEANGSYRWDGSEDQRKTATSLWAAWLEKQNVESRA
jgi:HEAT repeat protein